MISVSSPPEKSGSKLGDRTLLSSASSAGDVGLLTTTGSHPIVSVRGGGSSSDSILTSIVLLSLLYDRADNGRLFLVGTSSMTGDVDLTSEVLALLSKSLNCSKSEKSC